MFQIMDFNHYIHKETSTKKQLHQLLVDDIVIYYLQFYTSLLIAYLNMGNKNKSLKRRKNKKGLSMETNSPVFQMNK